MVQHAGPASIGGLLPIREDGETGIFPGDGTERVDPPFSADTSHDSSAFGATVSAIANGQWLLFHGLSVDGRYSVL